MSNLEINVEGRKPIRTCVICRRKFTRKELLRHILGQDGNLHSDGRQIMPGRGWYCCTNKECLTRFAMFRPKQKAAARDKRQGR